MQVESNVKPLKKFELENIIDGMCDVVFYDNIKEIEEQEETKYTFDLYRLKSNYRDGLEKELEDDEEKFAKWLQLAKDTEYKENATEEINKLQEELNNTDYKIIKSSEYQLAGLEIPYNIAELHAKRQQLRDRIEELRMM